jgi:hypothetical protein
VIYRRERFIDAEAVLPDVIYYNKEPVIQWVGHGFKILIA